MIFLGHNTPQPKLAHAHRCCLFCLNLDYLVVGVKGLLLVTQGRIKVCNAKLFLLLKPFFKNFFFLEVSVLMLSNKYCWAVDGE